MDALLEWGPVRVWPYGLCAALGALAMLLAAYFRTRDARKRKTLEIFALLALPLGLCLARLAYCICDLDWIQDYFWETVLEFPGGGFLLYGALIGMGIALAVSCRITGESFGETADLLAAPFLLLTAVLAAADGLAGAGYGWKVEDWFNPENNMSLVALDDVSFFSRLPFAVNDAYYGYASWAVFLPVAAALLVCALLLFRRGPGRPGGTAALALQIYAPVRVLYESLRQDDILKWGFVRVNQILGGVALALLMALCAVRAARAGNFSGKRLAKALGLFLAGALLVLAMEFALEGKISVLEWMTMDICYTVTTLGCVLLGCGCGVLRVSAFGGRKDSIG